MSGQYYTDNEEWEKSFQEIFLRTKSNLEQVNQRYGYSSPDKYPETTSTKIDGRESSHSKHSKKSRSQSHAPNTVTIDAMEWQATLDRLQKLEHKHHMSELRHQSDDRVDQLVSRCQHLEHQVTLLSNELEKQRIISQSKDKWSDILEDLQQTVNKHRSGIVKLEHQSQDLDQWRDTIDKQVAKMNKALAGLTNRDPSGFLLKEWKEEMESFKDRIETAMNHKLTSITTNINDRIDANVQSFDRKIASLRTQIMSRANPAPSSPSGPLNSSVGDDSGPLSPFTVGPSSRSSAEAFSLSHSQNEFVLANVDVMVKGAVAREARDIEFNLESKLEERVQSAMLSRLYSMEKDLRRSMEQTFRHVAGAMGLQSYDDTIDSSGDVDRSLSGGGKYFDNSSRLNRSPSPTRGSATASPLLLRVKPLGRPSWENEMKSISGAVHNLMTTISQHDKHVHDMEVDMKVELRDLKRRVDELSEEEGRANQDFDVLYGKLERYEADRKQWEDRLAKEVEKLQNDVLVQYRDLSSRTLDDLVPLEKRLLIVERIAHDALDKFKGGTAMLESSFPGTSFYKKYELISQGVLQMQQTIVPNIQKDFQDLSTKLIQLELNNSLHEDLLTNLQTRLHPLEPYVHTSIPNMESSIQSITDDLSLSRETIRKLEGNLITILHECTELDGNYQDLNSRLTEFLDMKRSSSDMDMDLVQAHRESLERLEVDISELQRAINGIEGNLHEYSSSTSLAVQKLNSQMEHLQVEVSFSTEDVKRTVQELQQQYATIDMQNHLLHEQFHQLRQERENQPSSGWQMLLSEDSRRSIGFESELNDTRSSYHPDEGGDAGFRDEADERGSDDGFNFDNVYFVQDSNRPASPHPAPIIAPVAPQQVKGAPVTKSIPSIPRRTIGLTAGASPELSEGSPVGPHGYVNDSVNPLSRRRTIANTHGSVSSLAAVASMTDAIPPPSEAAKTNVLDGRGRSSFSKPDIKKSLSMIDQPVSVSDPTVPDVALIASHAPFAATIAPKQSFPTVMEQRQWEEITAVDEKRGEYLDNVTASSGEAISGSYQPLEDGSLSVTKLFQNVNSPPEEAASVPPSLTVDAKTGGGVVPLYSPVSQSSSVPSESTKDNQIAPTPAVAPVPAPILVAVPSYTGSSIAPLSIPAVLEIKPMPIEEKDADEVKHVDAPAPAPPPSAINSTENTPLCSSTIAEAKPTKAAIDTGKVTSVNIPVNVVAPLSTAHEAAPLNLSVPEPQSESSQSTRDMPSPALIEVKPAVTSKDSADTHPAVQISPSPVDADPGRPLSVKERARLREAQSVGAAAVPALTKAIRSTSIGSAPLGTVTAKPVEAASPVKDVSPRTTPKSLAMPSKAEVIAGPVPPSPTSLTRQSSHSNTGSATDLAASLFAKRGSWSFDGEGTKTDTLSTGKPMSVPGSPPSKRGSVHSLPLSIESESSMLSSPAQASTSDAPKSEEPKEVVLETVTKSEPCSDRDGNKARSAPHFPETPSTPEPQLERIEEIAVKSAPTVEEGSVADAMEAVPCIKVDDQPDKSTVNEVKPETAMTSAMKTTTERSSNKSIDETKDEAPATDIDKPATLIDVPAAAPDSLPSAQDSAPLEPTMIESIPSFEHTPTELVAPEAPKLGGDVESDTTVKLTETPVEVALPPSIDLSMSDEAPAPSVSSPPDPSTLSVKERMKLRQDAILKSKTSASTTVQSSKPPAVPIKSPFLPAPVSSAPASTNLVSKRSSVSSIQKGSVAAMAARFAQSANPSPAKSTSGPSAGIVSRSPFKASDAAKKPQDPSSAEDRVSDPDNEVEINYEEYDQ